MGRAWDTHYTATNTHPNSTGLGWVDGTGLGNLDTRLDTVDRTPTRDWPRLGGWDGPGKSRLDTRLDTVDQTPTRDWPRLEHPHATGLGWADGMGQGSDTQLYTVDLTPTRDQASVGRMGRAWDNNTHTQHNKVEGTGLGQQSTTRQHNTDSYGSGLMVGWMGRAWKTILYILTSIYDIRDNFSGPMVGWMGATTSLASWMGGWDGPGRPYYIYLLGSNTGACSFGNKPGPGWVSGMGWAAVVDISDPALSPPANQALVWVHTAYQASVGWLGRAWDIGFNIRHTGSLQRTRPRLGGWDGPGTSDTGVEGLGQVLPLQQTKPWLGGRVGLGISDSTSIIQVHCSGEPQALVGWKGRAWDLLTLTAKVHCSGEPGPECYPTNTSCPGWVDGTGLGYRLTTTAQFTTAVNRASAGWTGRAWVIPTNFSNIGSPLQWTRPRLGGWDGPGT
ncbi:hypothetical protein ASPFODRAFT_61637 [Aspergillus luchuensis CBS 106.47]|uniref:Uncharacterized protein n=1 Tax=Aspergillus luchuensis (strain CBS 106.47) TaxID=1137211 RepID=A0A1M3TDW0_ASPLC|nr:hypothetical protein ASPFODRAFT_61637 [Aspergillus luchuensis CBS 106.47]GAA86397.1 hypothetical protein AKAW_04511 [Aspergillus luchuensis IFO 4308]